MSQNGQTQFNNFAAHAARFLKCVWPFTYIYTEREKETERQREMYVIMKTICPPGYHHNGFVATHALGHMMYAHLASMRFEHSLCRGSLMTT